MPQPAWSAKRERQYEHIKDSERKQGRSLKRSKEIAARTVNKERARTGEARQSSSSQTKEQLYNEAKRMNIPGRSRMNKQAAATRRRPAPMTYALGVNALKLDHVAYWLADRDAVANFVTKHLGMHVIDRTDAFTLVGADARRGKLTLFAADGPREQGALKHVALRVSRLEGGERWHDLGQGVRIGVVEAPTDVEYDLDHVALYSTSPEETAFEYAALGFDPAAPGPSGVPRVEVGGAWVEFHPGEPGNPERPLLNHIAVLVDSADEHIAAANDLGVEIDNIVDAANTYAVFLRGPERVRIEYVEHKPTFSLR